MIHQEIFDTIRSLQKTRSLKSFCLAVGTNLALRFQHRESDDIGCFVDQLLEKKALN